MKKNLATSVWLRGSVAVALILLVSTAAWSHQNKKKKKSGNSDQPVPAFPLNDNQQIDHNIGEMLAAFQLGDTEGMHKYYSDNATFVRSGAFEPPIAGWAAYATDYKSSWSQFQGMQIIRSNTLIVSHTDFAYATYQWEFLAALDGKPFSAKGQTTLVFNKVNGNWLIVHNHTSEICPAATSGQPAAPHAVTPQPAASAPHPPGL
ncbi:MAG TPA: nuclear transport factor 2 family protein [Candidatus Acidoferrales bacterium]|nr:nuclear transport factor 2 family protein [Candidatus Acidoferrales bacterium]